MYYLPRLSTAGTQTGIAPWDWTPSTPFPGNIRTDKKARDAWANSPLTSSNFYTGFEGLNSGLRIRQGTEDDCNPPVREHFLVADYDFSLDEKKALEQAKAFKPAPNRLERTLSGNWRAVWFLEKPVMIPSYGWAKAFKKHFSSFAFDPSKMLPGFDKGAWEAPERFWTNSGEWFVIHDEKIPATQVHGWEFLASQKFNFKKAFSSVAIPADVAYAELEKKYPRLADWPGEFVLDSQGPTFWVDGSTSPKSAIVREAGMQTFSDHAGKGFFTWTELLGAAFTKAYEANSLGRAVEGIYYDTKNYWMEEEISGWQPKDVTNLRLALSVDRGVNEKPDHSGVSDMDRALRHIQRTSTIVGAAPFVCRRPGLVDVNGNLFLNFHKKPFIAPAPGAQVWGPNGNFPWISNFLEKLFDRGDDRQLQHFLAWLSHFYRSGIEYKPCSGLCIVIAGNAGTGKSFLIHQIIGKLAGGVGEAADYLMTGRFGSENFSKAVWAVDDAKSAADYSTHKRFSEALKRAVANDTVVYEEKYRVPCVISWFGRVCLSMNKDAESLRMIPQMDISIKDKISLYHVADKTITFGSNLENNEITTRELPYFAAFLRDFVTPDFAVGNARFGVKPWHDPEIFGLAEMASPTQAFFEIVDTWREDYFLNAKPDAEYWEGSSVRLHQALSLDESMRDIMRGYTHTEITRRMSQLIAAERPGFSTRKVHGKACHRIDRPEHLPLPANAKINKNNKKK